ncbi:hypothetical protein A2U94_15075 [Bacillus sp. VT 712]|uniref:Uncharacterized protein n=1 Tax=Priestia veravalensis TaxID=1414648 RepID=A0A0V8JPC2_9BACI|nr:MULTISPECIES: hypothetical protein [Bacillaceae]KSU88894.1 hypothetical protein AS180_05180 [Priestia veravalensis]KZB90610.1 hypothetical protein A2U94_15075 [Bacillus sp. VT 712]MCM3068365.1 hypothetical protein [Priestia flexa]MCP1188163.1 hypothetical protein [Priestia flexa]SCC02354.1 hypothetical protein GA0061087_100824 [Priestia flexa]
MKKAKKILSSIVIIFAILIPGSYVLAGSSSYTSTYSMTGGVFGRWIKADSTPTATVKLNPSSGVNDAKITIFLQKKYKTSYTDVAKKAVSSTVGSSTELTKDKSGSGEYRIYLRNYSGLPMRGSVSIKLTW